MTLSQQALLDVPASATKPRVHAAKQTAGYERGVVKGTGASFGRVHDYTKPAPEPVTEVEPTTDREHRGKAAFDAHRARLAEHYPAHPLWRDMPPLSREAWCDAAEAARSAP